jgi:hypothetical protein
MPNIAVFLSPLDLFFGLEVQEGLLKAARKALKPVSDKNPQGFDYEKFERLKAEEAALQVR